MKNSKYKHVSTFNFKRAPFCFFDKLIIQFLSIVYEAYLAIHCVKADLRRHSLLLNFVRSLRNYAHVSSMRYAELRDNFFNYKIKTLKSNSSFGKIISSWKFEGRWRWRWRPIGMNEFNLFESCWEQVCQTKLVISSQILASWESWVISLQR
jgi:hypothetical protein